MADKLTELFAMTLNLSTDQINPSISPANTEAWDSLANMLLIAGIEETFEIELRTDEIESMKDFGKVRALLEKRQVAFA